MKVIKSAKEMQALSMSERAAGRTIAVAPTMGYLHEGHKRLLETGRSLADVLVLTIFVNPAQFGPREDLSTYPRDLERDLKVARDCGVDVVFTPDVNEMYPEGYSTYVNVEGLSDVLCGASRPGHFRGVATVVLKLFNITMPHRAVFGKKDFQQLRIIKKMVEDLDVPVEIIGVETVREADGLALSSRNSYLSPEERRIARCVPESLKAAREEYAKGQRQAGRIIEAARKVVEKEPSAVIEYIEIRDPRTLENVDTIKDGAHLFIAVKIGRARLIDNCELV